MTSTGSAGAPGCASRSTRTGGPGSASTARTRSCRSTAAASRHDLVSGAGVLLGRWPAESTVEVAASVSTGEVAVLSEGAVGRRAGDGTLTERVGERAFRVSAGGFWQVHPGAAATLLDAVLDALDPRPGESVLDLYSGVGLFAATLAERVGETGRVTAVESDRGAVADARHNLADLPQVRVDAGRVDHVLRRPHLRRADLVVLDPPRSGAGSRSCECSRGSAARADRLRRVRPGGARARPGVVRRGGLRARVAEGVRPLPDDPPRGVRRRAGAREIFPSGLRRPEERRGPRRLTGDVGDAGWPNDYAPTSCHASLSGALTAGGSGSCHRAPRSSGVQVHLGRLVLM